MRPRKLSREQLLLRSALCFKQHGYTAASVSRLAQACGLSKAAFYYDFSSKDALLHEILEATHQQLRKSLFQQLRRPHEDLSAAYLQAHASAAHFFSSGGTGCLAGMLSAERPNLPEQIAEKVRAIFQDWEQAFYEFFRQGMDEQRAAQWAALSVADYEGAILMSRIRPEQNYLAMLQARILHQLNLHQLAES